MVWMGIKWSATGMMCSILPARFIKVKRKKISTGSRRWIFTFSSKGEKTDSCSPDTYDSPKEITCDDFDVVTEVQFGGSEGIYLDCYAEGRIQPECEKKRWHLGTYKTLETSLSAMQTLGALGGALTYFASEYLWENGERFLSNRDLRIRALQKRQKEEEAEKS